MASSNVLETSILASRVVQTDPASEMCEGLGACPVGVILVPGDNAAVVCRLAEELVMPKPHRAVEQLRCRDRESPVPEQVMKTRRDSPGTKCMKKYLVRIRGFVRMELVEEFITTARWISQVGEFLP